MGESWLVVTKSFRKQHLVHRSSDPDGNFRAHAGLSAVTSTALVLLVLHVIDVVL
jgi:hypothetical protein